MSRNENSTNAMQTDSECESDVSSIADSSLNNSNWKLFNREQFIERIDSFTTENRLLKMELETYKLRLKAAQQEMKQLKHASVHLQAKAEQEEEFISNTLLKKIEQLKKEKETLANNYEREEEFLTNDLSRKLQQLREEKQTLEHSLEEEQQSQINQLMKRIQRLEAETIQKQNTLDQLKREKIELENTLEKEQESLVNRLWKRMEKLEEDKRFLQVKLEQNEDQSQNEQRSIDSEIFSSNDQFSTMKFECHRSSISNVDHIEQLRREVEKLKKELNFSEDSHRQKMDELIQEEKQIRNENLRLQRKLQVEIDRREQLCRQLSESESSLEMDEERALNQRMKSFPSREQRTSLTIPNHSMTISRSRTVSSPSSNVQSYLEQSSHLSFSSNNEQYRGRRPSSTNNHSKTNHHNE